MRKRLARLLEDAPFLNVLYGHDSEWEDAADYLLANRVLVPPETVYFIVNKRTPYAFVSEKSSDYLMGYEMKDLKKYGYYPTKEEAEKALAEMRMEG